MAINGLTTLSPDEVAKHDRPISVITPDGSYQVLHFREGQVIAGATFWWAVVRTNEHWPEVYATSLEAAMGWLGHRLCETCF